MATAATFQSIIPSIVPFATPRTVQNLFSRLLGIDEIERVYRALRAMGAGRSIADRLLEFLAVAYDVSAPDLEHIPSAGPAIVTVNHPFGILEGAVLASMLARIRTDVRFLANGILTTVPELREMIIAVDPISGRRAVAGNGSGLRQSLEHLAAGGVLAVFPAGEVSHFQWKERAIADPEWNPAVARMVRIALRKGCRVPVVPAYVEGANSPLFHVAGLAHPRLRTALLGRELLNKRGRRIDVRVGAPIPPEKLLAIPAPREQADYLRWRTYLLANRERFKPRTALPLRREPAARFQPVADPVHSAILAQEIAALPAGSMLDRSADLEVYLSRADSLPNILRELGRLREITFRAAGEGTGKPLDLDEFDLRYLHLFVWNARKHELVGAYRLARTDVVRQAAGVRGLYTATLFRYGNEFLDRLGPALELGRSFVRQEYQKGFAPLLLLWKGIGRYIAANPRYKVLFGPVSISNQYEAASRELMVSFLEKYAMLREWTGLVRNRCAFRIRSLTGARRPAFPETGFDVEDLSAMVGDIEQKPAGIPVLLRQYLRLGGKLLGFNVDPNFANALDGLILVDLTKTEPKLLERYLGRNEAAAFLRFQKGN
jgi:putative hemolysin